MKRSKKVMALAARYARARAKRAKSTRRDPGGDEWEVIVGNIGTVYSGRNGAEARATFTEYAEQSKSAHGRASGEDVTLMRNGEPVSEYNGSPRDVRNKRVGNRAARVIRSLSKKRDPAKRYIVTRMKKDPKVPKRYQRSGWMTFDTMHQRHGQIWPTKKEAVDDAAYLNGLIQNGRDPAKKRSAGRKHPKVKEYPSKHGKRDAGTLWVIWGPVSLSWGIFQGPDPFSPGGARQIGSEQSWAEADRFAKGFFS